MTFESPSSCCNVLVVYLVFRLEIECLESEKLTSIWIPIDSKMFLSF